MKNIPTVLLIFLLFGLSNRLDAQESDWRSYVEQLAEEEGIDEHSIDNMYSELLYLESNPMDLNRVTANQLAQFPLLSAAQATSLISFLEKNRPLYTVYELRNVPTFNFQTVSLILPFFKIDSWNQQKEHMPPEAILKNGTHELQLRFDKTLTKRAGYSQFSDSILERYPNRKYRGEDFYTSLRYAFRYRNKIQIGFTAEKDAGEPFLQDGYTKGYDHYGAHMLIRDLGPLKTLVLGDYRLSLGQGLILNNDFAVIKSWGGEHVVRQTQQPKRHFSTAENGFFRGGAAVLSVCGLNFTAFYSYRKLDANLSKDGDITSFKVDGLHRTPLEIEKKRNSSEQVSGLNIDYRKGHFQMGVSGLYHAYNRMYNPVSKYYNQHYLRDSTHFNGSVDYSYQHQGFLFAGETAIARNGTVATLNLMQYRTTQGNNFTILYRYYPTAYNALHGQAFSEGSSLRNERGIYLGGEFSPTRKLTVHSYIDLVQHPSARYGADAPSSAIAYYILTRWDINNQSAIDLRYRYKRKEKNITTQDENLKPLLPYTTQKIRLRWQHLLGSGWQFRSNVDLALYKEKPYPFEKGLMLSQNIGYHGKGAFSGDAFVAFFNAESYEARLYSYERNLLNTFFMPSFYGKGIRTSLSGRYLCSNTLSLSVKMGHTHYYNRHTIGSGTEQINGNSRNDIWCYLRWKF